MFRGSRTKHVSGGGGRLCSPIALAVVAVALLVAVVVLSVYAKAPWVAKVRTWLGLSAAPPPPASTSAAAGAAAGADVISGAVRQAVANDSGGAAPAKKPESTSERPAAAWGQMFEGADDAADGAATGEDTDTSPDLYARIDGAQDKGVFETRNLFYSTADVDPLVTGQLYEFRDDTRDVYDGRSTVLGKWGLQEFTDNSTPGQVGTDIGPNSLSEYEGSILGFNDGIPEAWAFPSTPLRDYRPRRADYLSRGGPEIVNGDKLYPLFVQDNDPLIGEDELPGPNE